MLEGGRKMRFRGFSEVTWKCFWLTGWSARECLRCSLEIFNGLANFKEFCPKLAYSNVSSNQVLLFSRTFYPVKGKTITFYHVLRDFDWWMCKLQQKTSILEMNGPWKVVYKNIVSFESLYAENNCISHLFFSFAYEDVYIFWQVKNLMFFHSELASTLVSKVD